MTSHDFGVNVTSIPPLVTSRHKRLIPIPKWRHKLMTPPPPKPQENELPIESSCHCLKPKHLPVCTILLMQNIIKKQCAQFWPTGNSYDRPLSTHSSIAGEMPNWSMRSLATLHRIILVLLRLLWRHDISTTTPPPSSSNIVTEVWIPSPSVRDVIYGRPLGCKQMSAFSNKITQTILFAKHFLWESVC
jgi:hypothetical protein